jgi:RNA polymerase sigma-70 factor (ECF subfamily)
MQKSSLSAYELLKSHEGMIRKLLSLHAINPEDGYQEIYLQVQKSLGSFKGDSRISTWLYRVCLNTILTLNRNDRRLSVFSNDGSLNEFEGHANLQTQIQEKMDAKSTLVIALSKLNDPDRQLIVMYLEGFTDEEIASVFGLTSVNVRVKVHRIKLKLQEWISRN